jgi:quinol monooxygenase YgiN
MAFIQIIEFRTDQIDEVRELDAQWQAQAKSEGATTERAILCADRDDPGRCMQIVFFESYEDAEKNSKLPITQAFAGKMMALADGAPTFHNLDVVEDRDTP